MSVEIWADPGATWKADTGKVSWERMHDLIHTTAIAGAQVFKPQLLRRGMYRDGTKASELVSQYEVPAEWLLPIKTACENRNLELVVTAYRALDIPLIDPYVKRFKIASFDARNPHLRKAIQKTGKPVVISTGLLSDSQVSDLRWNKWASYDATFLHCVSAYPAPPETQNLSCILRDNYDTEGYDNITKWMDDRTGFSDHTIGHIAAVMAVAYGAKIIEKHIRHSLTPESNPDYAAAVSPSGFYEYVWAIRDAEAMIGDQWKKRQPVEWSHYAYDHRTGRRGGD